MKRYNILNRNYECNTKANDFIIDVLKLSKKHGVSLGHEDIGGAFIIHEYKEANIEWLKDASIYF